MTYTCDKGYLLTAGNAVHTCKDGTCLGTQVYVVDEIMIIGFKLKDPIMSFIVDMYWLLFSF